MSLQALPRPTTAAPSTLRQAVARLGGACCAMLVALNETDPARRARARDKLFDAAMWTALLILEEDEREKLETVQEETCLT